MRKLSRRACGKEFPNGEESSQQVQNIVKCILAGGGGGHGWHLNPRIFKASREVEKKLDSYSPVYGSLEERRFQCNTLTQLLSSYAFAWTNLPSQFLRETSG